MGLKILWFRRINLQNNKRKETKMKLNQYIQEKQGKETKMKLTKFVENSKYGLKDENDKIVVSCNYDFIEKPQIGTITPCWKGGKIGFITDEAKLIEPIYDTFASFGDKFIVKAGQKQALISKQNGEFILPLIYDDMRVQAVTYLYSCSVSMTKIKQAKKKTFLLVKKDEKFGLFDEDCKELFPAIYDEVRFGDEFIHATKDGKTTHFVYENKTGNQNSVVLYETNGYITTASLNERCGVLDANGKELVPFIYHYVDILDKDGTNAELQNLLEVGDGSSVGVIDEKGNEIVPLDLGLEWIQIVANHSDGAILYARKKDEKMFIKIQNHKATVFEVAKWQVETK